MSFFNNAASTLISTESDDSTRSKDFIIPSLVFPLTPSFSSPQVPMMSSTQLIDSYPHAQRQPTDMIFRHNYLPATSAAGPLWMSPLEEARQMTNVGSSSWSHPRSNSASSSNGYISELSLIRDISIHDSLPSSPKPQRIDVPPPFLTSSFPSMSPMTLVQPSYPNPSSSDAQQHLSQDDVLSFLFDDNITIPSPSFSSSTDDSFLWSTSPSSNDMAIGGDSQPLLSGVSEQVRVTDASFHRAFAEFAATISNPQSVSLTPVSMPSSTFQPPISSPQSFFATLPLSSTLPPASLSSLSSSQDLVIHPQSTTTAPSTLNSFTWRNQDFTNNTLTSLLNTPTIPPSPHRHRAFSIASCASSDFLWDQLRAKLLSRPSTDLAEDVSVAASAGLTDPFGEVVEMNSARARLVVPSNRAKRQRAVTFPGMHTGVGSFGVRGDVEFQPRTVFPSVSGNEVGGEVGKTEGVKLGRKGSLSINGGEAPLGKKGSLSLKGGETAMSAISPSTPQTSAMELSDAQHLLERLQGEVFASFDEVMQSTMLGCSPSRWSTHMDTDILSSPLMVTSRRDEDVTGQSSPARHSRQHSFSSSLGSDLMSSVDGCDDDDREKKRVEVKKQGKRRNRRNRGGKADDDLVDGRRGRRGEDGMFYCQADGCDKAFSRKFNLKTHMSIHNPSRPRPFQCSYPDCTKSFTRSHDLDRHGVVHAEDKMHRCDVCLTYFSRSDARKRHKEMGKCRGPFAAEFEK